MEQVKVFQLRDEYNCMYHNAVYERYLYVKASVPQQRL
jgi:hypothetical protein